MATRNWARWLILKHVYLDLTINLMKIPAKYFKMTRLYSTSLIEMLIAYPAIHVSRKTFNHFLQLHESDFIRKYDYGKDENLIHYGQVSLFITSFPSKQSNLPHVKKHANS